MQSAKGLVAKFLVSQSRAVLAAQSRILTDFIDKRLKQVARDAKKMDRMTYQQIVSYSDLRHRVGYDVPIPPLRGYAISPDMAMYLWNLLITYRPKNILDLGSGVSSAIIAKYCVEHGASATSVDHDIQYGQTTQKLVKSWNAQSAWSLVVAEVKMQGDTLFYDIEPLRRIGKQFDFVFVDGPPEHIHPMVRSGLLPLFLEIMAPGCAIVMDDYQREGEIQAVSSWVARGYVTVIEKNIALEKHGALLELNKETSQRFSDNS